MNATVMLVQYKYAHFEIYVNHLSVPGHHHRSNSVTGKVCGRAVIQIKRT